VPPPARTETYPSEKRKGYLRGTDPVTALRVHGNPIELPFLAGQEVATLGRKGDLRVDHPYLSALHIRLERISGDWLRVTNISEGRKNPLIFEHREVSECYIKPGNQFRIGDTIYYALNEEMRNARRTVTEVFGEPQCTEIDDCMIAAAVDADRHIVLIGEPGGGQEQLGRGIHRASTRRHNPFVDVPATRTLASIADLQLIRDARDGTLLLWVPMRGKLDQNFVSRILAPHTKVRLIICAHAPGKVDASFPAAATDEAPRFTIPPIRERKQEIPLLMDRWFVEEGSSLRFKAFVPEIQENLLAYRWPGNLRELQAAVTHLMLLARYRSEREATRDNSITRSESRMWRQRLKLPVPILPPAPDQTAASRKKAR
jgi:hypothetical protein